MKFLAWLKTYAAVIVTAALGVLATAATGYRSAYKAQKKKTKQAKANEKHTKEVLEQDIAINEQEDVRLKDAKDEISTNHHSTELSSPDHWVWDDDPD